MSFIGVVWYVEAVKDSFVFMVGTPPVFYTIHCLCESVNFHKLSFWLKIYAFLPFQTLNEFYHLIEAETEGLELK